MVEVKSEARETEPPSRFTEASLIRELEEKGIGRPSTYAPIVSTLVERRYVKKEKKYHTKDLELPMNLFLLMNTKTLLMMKYKNN